MGKRKGLGRDPSWNSGYESSLRVLQIELVKVQRHVIRHGHKVLIIFEGRDASGKDGTIKRIVEHLSPRETRVVALGKPSDKDAASWYFQRYVPHLPSAEEMVLFNRSWYNRAGVERVMGFCTDREYADFMKAVVPFEEMLVAAGMQIIKYYLDIGREEQKERLQARRDDPLKQWKSSPIDQVALKHWAAYSEARDRMLERTSSSSAPWIVVRADSKHRARLNVIRDLLARLECPETDKHLAVPDKKIVLPYKQASAREGFLAA
jgi:polyphosphate kinase 2